MLWGKLQSKHAQSSQTRYVIGNTGAFLAKPNSLLQGRLGCSGASMSSYNSSSVWRGDAEEQEVVNSNASGMQISFLGTAGSLTTRTRSATSPFLSFDYYSLSLSLFLLLFLLILLLLLFLSLLSSVTQAASPPGQGQLQALSLNLTSFTTLMLLLIFVVIIVCCQCYCYDLSSINMIVINVIQITVNDKPFAATAHWLDGWCASACTKPCTAWWHIK